MTITTTHRLTLSTLLLATATACGPTVIVAKPVPAVTTSPMAVADLTKPPTLAPPPRLTLPP
ncbi:MAG: hypothetical protein ABR499_04690, partial [Gemmatimonadaceae bacterium]